MVKLIGLMLVIITTLNPAWSSPQVLSITPINEQFTISLPSNPTTGFQLKVKNFDSNALQLVKSRYIPPKTQLIGAGGKMEFTFRRLNPDLKTTIVQFQNARSWEPGSAMTQNITIQFK